MVLMTNGPQCDFWHTQDEMLLVGIPDARLSPFQQRHYIEYRNIENPPHGLMGSRNEFTSTNQDLTPAVTVNPVFTLPPSSHPQTHRPHYRLWMLLLSILDVFGAKRAVSIS